MKKSIKITLLIILSLMIISISIIGIRHLIKSSAYPECYNSGGKWKRFSDGCADDCDRKFDSCELMFTESCDCGKDKCWDGRKCILD